MITQGVCFSFLEELFQGIHTNLDTYMMAIFTSAADLDKTTTEYDPTGEASGDGYDAGGQELTGFQVTTDSGKTIISWDSPIEWNPSTLTGRGALIYNASKSNRAVMVIDFGEDKISANGPFFVYLPAATAAAGLIRFNNN
jgi:hypothetical protein